jgi:hypothetical protein
MIHNTVVDSCMYLSPGDVIGSHAGLRNQILGVRVSSGAPSLMVTLV